jgi:hypothetical protein
VDQNSKIRLMKKRNVLFLSYWSLREPLNAAAVFPYLRLLSERDNVGNIHLVTMETTRGFLPEVDLDIPRVRHHAIFPGQFGWYMFSKMHLQFKAIRMLAELIRREDIGLVIAKASMAGAIAHVLHILTGTPYIVESFEPHSEYMLECGVWKKSELRYRYSRFMEQRQLKSARHIITVTHNHRDDLIAEGHHPLRIKVIPSITDLTMFHFSPADRSRIRSELGIGSHAVIGIYVGKFGGLYYDEEAFLIFAKAFEHFEDLHLVILSPSDPRHIEERSHEAGIPMERLHVLIAQHVDVPAYLSAADLAFSTIKPSPIKRYQCPIKNGEYWATGLPIVMTDGISDDYKLMRQGIGGSVFKPDLSDIDEALKMVKVMVADPDHREKIVKLARKYKSLDIAREVYDEILNW